MDKMAKVLLLACFILVGALGFTIGMLINIWEENLPTPYTLNKTINHTSSDNTTDNSKSSGLKYDEYGRPICPYCGISCSVPIKIPYLLDENGYYIKHATPHVLTAATKSTSVKKRPVQWTTNILPRSGGNKSENMVEKYTTEFILFSIFLCSFLTKCKFKKLCVLCNNNLYHLKGGT